MSYKIKEMPNYERPRERLIEFGASNLSDKEILAILLKCGTKNKNVNEIALELLNMYPIEKLSSLTTNELKKIKGIGDVKAIEFLAAIELGKRIFVRKKKELLKLENPKDIWEESKYLFNGLKQEYFYCFYFNNKQELIEKKLLFIGTINNSIVHPREIFKEAYKLSACTIVCLHNHPSNDLTPSKEDISLTESLIKIGTILGIPVVDHIIVGENNYYSFYENSNIINI